jgi:hypothetical protein
MARPAADEWGCARRTSRLIGVEASACGPRIAAVAPGKFEQVNGGRTIVSPEEASAIVAAMPMLMAQ